MAAIKLALPDAYKEALQALKDQAKAVSAQLHNKDSHALRVQLADAQRRMAMRPIEVKHIVSALLKSNDKTLTIESIDEQRAAKELAIEVWR